MLQKLLSLVFTERSWKCVARKFCKRTFIAVSHITAKTGKQLKCPLVDKWIKKMWSIQTTEYYLELKGNEMLGHEKTWKNFKSILLSERSQSVKATYYKIPEIWYSIKDKAMERVKRSVLPKVVCPRKMNRQGTGDFYGSKKCCMIL